VATHNRANHLFIAFPLSLSSSCVSTTRIGLTTAPIDMPDAHCRPAPLA
jgi:hypothetical protein